MYEYNRFKLKNGTIVEYTDHLVPDGVVLNVKTRLNRAEKKEFRYEMQFECDVVRINF